MEAGRQSRILELSSKPVFTTGEAAALCKVSQQTIIRCFDRGRISGFRVPGSRFRRIPRAELLRFMEANEIPVDFSGPSKHRVLVVDDDAGIVRLVSDLLQRDGRFEVRTATTGYDAGMLTRDFRPDVLLLDYMLPDVNGNVVCERLRSDPVGRETRILIVSGVVRQREIDGLLAAGADDFLAKPFDGQELVHRIESLVADRHVDA